MRTSVTYYEIYSDGRSKKHANQACYARITLDKLYPLLKSIIVYDTIEDFTESEIMQWFNQMNEWGFKINYVGKGDKELSIGSTNYVFEVPLFEEDGITPINDNKRYLTTTLIMFRYLIELPFIIKYWFEVTKKYPDADKFSVFHLAHSTRMGFNYNHALFDDQNRELFTTEKLKTLIKHDDNYKLFERDKSCNIESLFMTRISHTLPGTSILDRLNDIHHKLKVYVVGGDVHYAIWLNDYIIVDKITDAELVMFTGGEDVSPSLYNEPVNPLTSSNRKRDLIEKKAFIKAKELELPMIGICRGAQFLCVMSGGRLVQHQDNPNYIHKIRTNYGNFDLTSTHHQAQYVADMPIGTYRVIGYAAPSQSVTHLDGNGKEMPVRTEVEIAYYPMTKCLGIQGHPEMEPMVNSSKYEYTREILQTILFSFLNKQL